MNAATNAAHDYQRAVRSRTLLKATFTGLRSVYPIATAILVVAYGAVGEIMAITALQSQTGGTQTFVATAAVLLTLVTAAGPALTCGKSLLNVLSLLTADSPGTADARTSTARTPPTEPGKTDAQED